MSEGRARIFLESTLNGYRSIEQSHDFFAGTDVALHNLRWQINGLRQTYPEINQAQLQQFLVPGQTNSTRDNAFSLILHRPWEEQLEMHRRTRLVNLFAIYEGWLSATADELNITGRTKRDRFVSGLQGASTHSVANALNELGNPSPVMAKVALDCQGHRLSRNPNQLEALLTCYRAFKEVRNAITHNGSIANQRTTNAWTAYDAIRHSWPVQRCQPPILPQPVAGVGVTLSSYSLIGFSHVLLILMTTVDSVASHSEKGLEDAVKRWTTAYGKSSVLPADHAKAHQKFRSRCGKAGLPRLSDDAEVFAEFRSRGLIF